MRSHRRFTGLDPAWSEPSVKAKGCKPAVATTRPGRRIAPMAGESPHAKRVRSVTNAVVGVVNAVSPAIHAIGAGLAAASGRNAKHAIEQVDRLSSNSAPSVWALSAHRVPSVVASRQETVVALD